MTHLQMSEEIVTILTALSVAVKMITISYVSRANKVKIINNSQSLCR